MDTPQHTLHGVVCRVTASVRDAHHTRAAYVAAQERAQQHRHLSTLARQQRDADRMERAV
jgi:hypothetical protein